MQIRTPVRHRLLEHLEAGSGLTVIHAPAGSGKTTLLRAWGAERARRGLPVLWVNLTPETRATQQVRDAVSAAVTETGVLEGLTGKRAETLRDLGDEMPAREALGTLFSIVPGLVLVIDGGEHVTEDPDRLWAELFTLVRNHPHSRAVLATRWLHRRRAELLALDPAVDLVGDELLALRKDEVADVVGAAVGNATGLELAERLTGETDGHPLAVMAGLVAGDGDPEVALRLWRRLVKDHTLADLERLDLLGVLEASAATPLTDAALAAALGGTDERSAQAALQRAEANGYGRWRDAADGRSVFEMSGTARNAVGEGTPLEDPDKVVTWLVERDELGHALEVAVRAGLLERATGLYRRLLVVRPLDFTATFDRRLRTVPTEALLRHPMLAVARGVALLASPATQQEATAFLEPIAQRDPREVHEATPDDELMDLTAQSVVLGVLGRPTPSAAVGLEAVRRLEDPEFAQRVDPTILAPLSCMLSQSLMDAGHVEAAQRLISRGAAVASPELVHHTALYGRAWYGLDGRMAEARDMDLRVGHGIDLPGAGAAGVTWGPRTKAVEGLGAGLLLLERWDFAAAEAHVEVEQTPRWDPIRSWREWLRLHVALGRGTHDRAVRELTVAWEEGAGPGQFGLGAAALTNAMAICWLASGNVSRAHQMMDSAEAHPGQTAPARLLSEIICSGPESALHLATRLRVEPGHTVRSRAAVETLAAAAALRTGGTQLAEQLLAEAATLHAEHGCRAHLLYLLSSDRAALLQLAATGFSTSAQHYLAGLEVSSGLPDVSPSVSLSRRERAVLQALATHGSRADMAYALHVSENTVKSQLRSIYRKLDVRHRTEAINRALELDLLREDAVRDF